MYGLSTPRANATAFVLGRNLEIILSRHESVWGCRWYWLFSCTECCIGFRILINIWPLIWDCFMAIFESRWQLIIVSTLRFSTGEAVWPILKINLIAIHAGLPHLFQLFLRRLFLFLHLADSSRDVANLSRWNCCTNSCPVEVLTAYRVIILDWRPIWEGRHPVLLSLPLFQKLSGTSCSWCGILKRSVLLNYILALKTKPWRYQ